jgi:hypothetical protein
LVLTKEEWAFLDELSTIWFRKTRRKKWVIARLVDELRILFQPPPGDEMHGRTMEFREEDWKFILWLKRYLGFDSTAGVVRGLLYLLENSPPHLFPHPFDLPGWDEDQGLEDRYNRQWMLRILNHIKGMPDTNKRRKTLKDIWHTCRIRKNRERLTYPKFKRILLNLESE